ncbi:MAG: hypothetical protein HYV77_00120 [Candidatus Wildermuthbacteria bacterium]|nr:hypothetical protein [Candidatus Wildermuthbacteria bacterium]
MWNPAIKMWHWWREEMFDSKQKSIMVDVRVPGNVEKPYKAMENVFVGFWQAMHDAPDVPEKWLEGKYQKSFAIEVVSIEGEVHFYFRFPAETRKNMESAVYAQFPDAEFTEVEDYTKKIPPDIPNKDWRMWGTNYRFEKPNVYPIKTYSRYFEPNATAKEEYKIDPMALLLEGLGRLGKGEQLWIQYILKPITPEDDYNYVNEGRQVVDEIVNKRLKPATQKGPGTFTFLDDIRKVVILLLTGQEDLAGAKEAEKEDRTLRDLTPGEKDLALAIDEKISKYAFMASVRFIYLAKEENYFSPAKAAAMQYFTQFSSQTLNKMRPLSGTLTKTNTIFTRFMDARSTYLKKRRLFRHYTMRVPAFFPNVPSRALLLLNTEEMATLFRLPSKLTVPTSTLPRIESKRGAAPPELPFE